MAYLSSASSSDMLEHCGEEESKPFSCNRRRGKRVPTMPPVNFFKWHVIEDQLLVPLSISVSVRGDVSLWEQVFIGTADRNIIGLWSEWDTQLTFHSVDGCLLGECWIRWKESICCRLIYTYLPVPVIPAGWLATERTVSPVYSVLLKIWVYYYLQEKLVGCRD